MITIIGTSHIAKESVEKIKAAFVEKPDIVAIELDAQRLQALTTKKRRRMTLRDIRYVGLTGFFFMLLGHWAEHKLGNSVGVKPGADMLTAYRIAKKNKVKVALIDQQIAITLKRLTKEITWREKWRFMVDLWNGIILKKQEHIQGFDLRSVPNDQLIATLLTRVKTRYPNLHKVLVEERNQVMARNLKHLEANNPGKHILAIIGAGHKEGIQELMKEDITYSFTINTG